MKTFKEMNDEERAEMKDYVEAKINVVDWAPLGMFDEREKVWIVHALANGYPIEGAKG